MADDATATTGGVVSNTNDLIPDVTAQEGGTKISDAPLEQAKDESSGDDAGDGDSDDVAKTNGHTENNEIIEESISQETGADDTEMKDIEEQPEAAATKPLLEVAPTNGTPASSAKKASNGSSKKKSSAIPEHKTKKLNRKKSKPALRLDAKPGQLYLARMKGHQPWPSVICDEEMLPEILLNSRPITTAQPDGTFKKPEYEDGGKRAYERTFPIMFLHTNEFAWIINTELTPLDPEECKDVAEKGKSKSLIEAYKIAAENYDLSYFKEMLVDHMNAMQEDAEARAERDAKKANKAKRKSMDATTAGANNGDVDEMDVDEEVDEAKPKAKKRKKSLDSDGVEDKPTKTPKISTKLKLSTPKTPAADTATKKKAVKPKASVKKSAAKVNGSDEEMADTPKVEEKPLTPAEAKEKKEKEIRYYRHKLQRGFLSRDDPPAEEEIKSMSGFLSKLETYPDLEGSIIRATKIHKVLKAMIRLGSIPKDEEFQFKERSHSLLQKWNKILQEDPSAAAADAADKDDDTKPEIAVNGVSKDVEDQAAKAEAGEAAAPEEDTKEQLEKKIGTTVEGEKEAEEDADAEKEGSKAVEKPETDAPNVETKAENAYQPPAKTLEVTA